MSSLNVGCNLTTLYTQRVGRRQKILNWDTICDWGVGGGITLGILHIGLNFKNPTVGMDRPHNSVGTRAEMSSGSRPDVVIVF